MTRQLSREASPRARLGLIVGEPAGVGPELAIRLAQQARDCDLVAFADPDVLTEAANRLGLPLALHDANDTEANSRAAGHLVVTPHRTAERVVPGTLNVRNAQHVLDCMHDASRLCLSGVLDGLVTGPVHKGILCDAGVAFSGMTGFLATQAGLRESDVVMMLANPQMRVALVTTHLPLRAVADSINADLLERVTTVLHGSLQRDFGIARPRIAVLGLNPHAGEDGHLGTEERDIFLPWLTRMRARGFDLVGPLPADTAFLPQRLTAFDAVLAMYHDQGLPVLKFSGFQHAVNISLGLPYVRVAVDHGTALDLAGRGLADHSSLVAALTHAERFVQHRREHCA